MSRHLRRERLRGLMDRLDLGALLMRRPANFAWTPSLPGATAEQTFVLAESEPEVIGGREREREGV